jgi:hypothetical protein
MKLIVKKNLLIVQIVNLAIFCKNAIKQEEVLLKITIFSKVCIVLKLNYLQILQSSNS